MWMTTGFYVNSRNGIKQITTRKIKDYMKRCIRGERVDTNERGELRERRENNEGFVRVGTVNG